MFTSLFGRGHRASLHNQLVALITAAFILLQPALPGTVAVAQRLVKRKNITANVAGTLSTVFINEILYDITGTDAGEFVEVAGPAGTNLTGWTIVLYNGSNGLAYDTDSLPTPIPSQQGGYGTVSISYASNGIQNGAPDGIALVNNGTLVQFLCYEGTFAATDGPANGQTCTSIGVFQDGTNAAGTSLQLQGTGDNYGDFTWNATSIAHTQNLPNTGQTFSGGPPVDIAPTVSSTVPTDNALNVAVNTNISVTFSEPVTATGSSFTISCSASSTHAFSLSGGTTTYTLDPTVDFTQGEICTVTVVAAQVADQDGTPNNMALDYVFDFTVINSTPVKINQIQGSGATSPLAGQAVTTTGIVTLLRTSTNNGGAASGFFLQEPTATNDADPNTSEGIFVFTTSVPTVAVGDNVTVTGTAVEFNGLTEISPVSSVIVNSTGNGLPDAIVLTATILDPTAPPTQPQLEKYEGMRMSSASLNTVAPNDEFFDVDTVLSSVPRPLREPGIEISQPVPPDPTSGTPDCCIPRWDENPERLSVDTNGRAGSAINAYTSNVTFSSIAGPLDFAFGRYRLIPETSLIASANMSAVPVPTPTSTEFTVAGFNIENFNNNATQRQKAALAIRDVMKLPDIIGHAEIFELTGLQALAAEVNAIAPGVSYQAFLVEADSTTGDADQDVGYLVNTARVQVDSVTQIELAGCLGNAATCNTYIDPTNGQPAYLNDRPPLVLRARVQPLGVNLPVIVVVNHLRSFIDIELVTGEGPRVRAKRTAQAEFLADLLQDLQSGNPGTSVISVGDYNAYQFNDGYTDPLSVIKGNPTPDDQIVVDQSPDLVNPNFINLIDDLPADERYSFIFEGTPQALDHVLVNTVANGRKTRIAIARNNADFPEFPAAAFVSNAARPERNSDHDMPVAYFSLGAQPLGSVLISEFRLRGPGPVGTSPEPNGTISQAATDEFVEIYNNTNAAIVVSTTDGTSGWSVVASDGVARFTIPNGTVIPARGHYLGVNSLGYSLAGYPAGNGTSASGDISYTNDIPDNAGIALFNTSLASNFVLANRLDAVGSASEANTLYKEGTGYPALNPAISSQHSWVRNLSSGLPKDTNVNPADFVFVDTQATDAGAGAHLGAPGPENLSSPIQRNATIKASLVFPCVQSSASPNRIRDLTPVFNGSLGTLDIRRKFTNHTGGSITRLRFRIVDITTAVAPPGTADLRAITSSDVPVASGNNPCGTGALTLRGSTLEEPPNQIIGGGLNSSLSMDTVTLGTPLGAGASIDLRFLLGVQQGGTFRFFVNVEALP
ncbi:MAG: Ig-like domain-containing protein [Pyrinomonadaceae bacterium]